MAFPTWLYTLKNRLEHHQSQRTGRRRASRRSATGRLASEQLEVRLVLSATFGGALSIGTAVGESGASDVATDQSGNSYMTGSFSGTVDFDPNAVHVGDTDILTALGTGNTYIAKYAPDNSLLWVQRIGGASDAIKVDASGNVYVVGNFRGSQEFGSTILSTAGDFDGFVAKLDAGGTVQWAKSWGTTEWEWGQGVGVDSAGNVYALSTQAFGRLDVLKFSPTGTAVWSQSIAAQPNSWIADLAVNASGNVFVAGSFRGTVDFDPGPKAKNVSTNGNDAGFVLKLDTNGKFGWVSPFLGGGVGATSGSSHAESVALDNSDNVVVGGSYRYSVDFDPRGGTTILPIIGGGFITKLNSSGGLVWARALESASWTSMGGLAVDAAGSIYATGIFSGGTIDLNPGAASDTRTSAGGYDIFVVKLTAAGNSSWAYTFGGTGDESGRGIAVDTAGTVHIAGWYQNTIDFDPDPLATYYLTTGALRNGFLLRLRQV